MKNLYSYDISDYFRSHDESHELDHHDIKLYIGDNGKAITNISIGENKKVKEFQLQETNLIKAASEQIFEYLAGNREEFHFPMELEGTEFQKKVWHALMEIPYGKTCSYKAIAEKIGNSKASRAVGMANNKNPIGVVVPCHRVIGKNGSLVGYAGGVHIKKKLLEIEKCKY